MTFVEKLRQRAARPNRRIVFPETGDERVLAAASRIARMGMAQPLMVVDGPFTEAAARDAGLATHMSQDTSPLEAAHKMVAAGKADACVAGAVYTT